MSQYHAMNVDPARPDGQDQQPNPFLSSVPLDPAIGADGADAHGSTEQQHAPIDSSSQMPMLPSAGSVSTWTHTDVGSPPLLVDYGWSPGTQAQVSPISSTGAEWGQPMTNAHYVDPYRPAGSADAQSLYPLEPQYAPGGPSTQMPTRRSDQVPFSPLANGFQIPCQSQYVDGSRNIQTQYSPMNSSCLKPMVAPYSDLVGWSNGHGSVGSNQIPSDILTTPDSAGPSDEQLSDEQLSDQQVYVNNPFRPPNQFHFFNVSQDNMTRSLTRTGQPSVVSQQQGPVTFDTNDLQWRIVPLSPPLLFVASRKRDYAVILPQRANYGGSRKWTPEDTSRVKQQLRRDEVFSVKHTLIDPLVNQVSKVVEELEPCATVPQIAVTTDRLCRELKDHGYNPGTASTAS